MLTVDPWFFYYAAVLVLIVPVKWLFAAAFAAAFHEVCHIATIMLLGEKIHNIQIRPWGITIDVTFSDAWRELAAALAGPMGSFSLLLLCHLWPSLALCAFAQGLFNLLPVYPMDGGRAVRCLVFLLWQRTRGKIPCKGRSNAVQ